MNERLAVALLVAVTLLALFVAPLGVLGATLLFGAFQALETQLGGTALLPPTVVQSLPFILTMLVLAGFVGRAIPPKAIGKPFQNG